MHLVSAALFFLFASAPQQEPNEHLKPLAWLEGSWVGTGHYGASKMEDRITYELTHNGHFLKFKAVARMGGKVVQSGTGMLGYDKAKKRLVIHSYFTSGEIGMSESLNTKVMNTWHFAVRIGDQRPWNDARSIMRKLDEDTHTYVVQMKKDGEFVTFYDATYKREKNGK